MDSERYCDDLQTTLLRKRELDPAFGIGCLRGGNVKFGDEYLFGLALVQYPKRLSGNGIVLYFTAAAIAKHQHCGGDRKRARLLPAGAGLLP